VDTNGAITTFGNGTQGCSGDGGPALQAEFTNPTGVFVDVSGNVFLADVGNQRIRRMDSDTWLCFSVSARSFGALQSEGGRSEGRRPRCGKCFLGLPGIRRVA
jgi:trimeric autotransporter adhesin